MCAQQVADHLGIRHHPIQVDEQEVRDKRQFIQRVLACDSATSSQPNTVAQSNLSHAKATPTGSVGDRSSSLSKNRLAPKAYN